jgi:hypothetical protein
MMQFNLSGMRQSPLAPRLVTNPRNRRGDPESNIQAGIDRTGGADGQGAGDTSNYFTTVINNFNSRMNDFETQVGDLQSQVDGLQAMMDGASIEATCNEDGTITVTLTWGTPPE